MVNNGTERIFHRDANGLLHETYWTGSAWQDANLNLRASRDPAALYDGYLRLYAYVGTDLHQYYQSGSTWVDSVVLPGDA